MTTNSGSVPDLPLASLIICSRNRPKLLLETIQSVFGGEEVPAELIIVDQSDEQNLDLVGLRNALCQIQYLCSNTIGLCRARNIGVAIATKEICAFIDDDMWVESNWFHTIIKSLVEAGPRAVVTGRVLSGEAEQPGSFVPALVTEEQPRSYEGRIGKDVLAAGHMAMYRSTIEQVGRFDERLGAGSRFGSADDNDYGFRLLEAGYRIIYEPLAVVYHRSWRAEKDYYPLRWSYGRGKGGFYSKYLSLQDPYMLFRMLKDLLIRFIRFPWRVLHKPRLAIGDLCYAFGIISGSFEWLRTYPKKQVLNPTSSE